MADISTPAPAPPERPAWPAMRRGLRQRCPACGRGHLFSSYLKLRRDCRDCGEDLSHARADDGPAFLTLLIAGHALVPLMLSVYIWLRPPPLVLALTFSVGIVALSLALLPRLKGMLVGIQWAKRMHGF